MTDDESMNSTTAVPTANGGHGVRVAAEAFRQTVWLQMTSWMAKALAVVAVLFSVGLVVVVPRAANEVTGEQMFAIAGAILVFQMALPVLGVWFGIQSLAADREGRTLVWLLSRHAPRWSLFLGKWAAATVVTGVWIGLVLVVMQLALEVPGSAWQRGIGPSWDVAAPFLLMTLPAAAGYTAVGILAASWLRRPVLIGLLFVVGWEFFTFVLPGDVFAVRAMTVGNPVRRELASMLPSDQVIQGMFEEFFRLGPAELGAPWFDLGRFVLVVLTVGMLVFVCREADVRPKE